MKVSVSLLKQHREARHDSKECFLSIFSRMKFASYFKNRPEPLCVKQFSNQIILVHVCAAKCQGYIKSGKEVIRARVIDVSFILNKFARSICPIPYRYLFKSLDSPSRPITLSPLLPAHAPP